MTTTTISKKIQQIELELAMLKKIFKPERDFDIDEKNWNKVEGLIRRSRKSVYQKIYGKN